MSILDSLYNTKYIGFIDIEFQILQDKIRNRPDRQQPYILELGLIIFEKGKDTPLLIDHVNFPLLKNRNIQLISSKYCTVTKQTEDKMIKVEENFTINVSDPDSIKNNKELIRFIPNSNVRNKLKNNNIDSDEIEKIQKNVDLLRFNLFRNRLSGKYTNYFNQILDLYNNDELVKKRLINPTNYLNKLKEYLLDMTLVHKENMDIMALNNDFKMYNININKDNILTIQALKKHSHDSKHDDKNIHWHHEEHSLGKIRRAFRLPENIKPDGVKVTLTIIITIH